MKVTSTELPGVLILEPEVYKDPRGFFFESYQEKKFMDAGIPLRFVQDNHSRSARGTLRGLHSQLTHAQGKLVRVTVGEVFDVAVDIRKGSPTFGRWVGVTLSAENFKQLYVPPGFAHGFCVTSESADFLYKCTDFYHPEDEIVVAWNDPALGIRWPLSEPTLSKRDAAALPLAQLENRLPIFKG